MKTKYYCCLFLIITCLFGNVRQVESTEEQVNAGSADIEVDNYKVFRFHFEPVSNVYMITLWIILGCLAKIGLLCSETNY